MIFENIYNDIVSSFGSLWRFKERGETLEIVTPFATTNNKFVSIFLTKQNSDFIVSDGGWITEGVYQTEILPENKDCYHKILSYYLNTFKIQSVASNKLVSFFYKKTSNEIAVPSLLFDMVNFISTIVSISNIEFADKETENKERFSSSASGYLSEIIRSYSYGRTISFNRYLGAGNTRVKVNAVIRDPNNDLVLLNYITGSHVDYFQTNISKTNIIFELASKTNEGIYIKKKIALVDNTATGYAEDKISIWLDHMINNTGSQRINWSNREQLETI